MPLRLESSSMVTSPSGNGVIILGGMSTEPDDDLACNRHLFEWKYTNLEAENNWVQLHQELYYPRRSMVAISLPIDLILPIQKKYRRRRILAGNALDEHI